MPLQHAEFKLREARFFLGRLQEEVLDSERSSHENFRYYLSAFLAAADTLREIGSKDDPAFYGYWATWKAALPPEDRALVTFMKAQRDSEIHKEGAEVIGERTLIVETPGLATLTPAIAEIIGLEMSFFPRTIRTDWIFEGLGPDQERDVVPRCARYLELLEGVVGEFSAARGSPPPE